MESEQKMMGADGNYNAVSEEEFAKETGNVSHVNANKMIREATNIAINHISKTLSGVGYSGMSKEQLKAEHDRLTAQIKEIEKEAIARRNGIDRKDDKMS